MVHDWKMELYWRLPIPVQEFGLSLYAKQLDRLYYSDSYESWRKKFALCKDWPREKTEEWQRLELVRIIELAATRVPYYREVWRDIDWRSISSQRDLSVLPLLDKQSLRQREKAFLVAGVDPKSLWSEKTSGTSGTALTVYWPRSMLPQWRAINDVMVRDVAGVHRKMPWAMLGGRSVVAGNVGRPPYWRFNRCWGQLYLSSYHVSPQTVHDYLNAMHQYGSRWITGYGSAIAALAEAGLESRCSTVELAAAIVSGDTLSPAMRTSIEQFFCCKCFDHYGQSERVAMAMECSYGRMHIIPFVGIWEILRPDGSPCEPGEVGEIVATGLLNDAMPLVRYRMGDYAAWAVEQSCPCGNRQPIISNLEGRTDDYLITKDGRKIGRLSTAMKRSPSIHSAQLVQDKPGHAFLLVKPGAGYQSSHATAVRDDVLERIGDFDLEVVEVADIPRTPQGKTVLVVRLEERPAMKELYDQLLRKNRIIHRRDTESTE
jgi:phenylacetate-CoA ligase